MQVTQLSQRDRAAGWGLEVRCSSQAHWKARSELHISDNWIFSLGIMAKAQRANIDWNLEVGVLKGWGQFGAKFQVEEDVRPPTICTLLDRPENSLQLCRHSRLSSRKKFTFVRTTVYVFNTPPPDFFARCYG